MGLTQIKTLLDGLSKSYLLQAQNIIVGGDINFMFPLKEFWGRHPRRDLLEGFFMHWIESHQIVDLEPQKMSQTWRNGHKGDDFISKRLDRISNSGQNIGKFVDP
jgi:hypothetical protein